MFIGRNREIKSLAEHFATGRPSFVVVKGRRRIGKSTLIQEFAKRATEFYEFQGLAPREQMNNSDQLDAFSKQLAKQSKLPQLHIRHWSEAFSLLASVISDQPTVVLLDEISWMARHDRDFAGQLKVAWDTEFKKKPNLMLVACGSVTSWIDNNILKNSGFVGRVSLTLKLEELSLFYCNQFWGNKSAQIATSEKIKTLAVTGGVPRYLEEIKANVSAESNIKRLCFRREGILFAEYERIFDDIFEKKAESYGSIVKSLVSGKKQQSEIATALGRDNNGHMGEHLDNLVEAGFLARDVVYQPSTLKRSRSYYRLKDNYLRFYLKFVEPLRDKIVQGLYEDVPIEDIIRWDVIIGLQVENLVLSNIRSLLKILSIDPGRIISASPYIQKATKRKKACQIDLLVQTRYALYICEIKFRREIPSSITQEMQEKISRLTIPTGLSIRPVLIYEGRLPETVIKDGYFDSLVSLTDLLEKEYT